METLQTCGRHREMMKRNEALMNYLVDGEFPTYVFTKIPA